MFSFGVLNFHPDTTKTPLPAFQTFFEHPDTQKQTDLEASTEFFSLNTRLNRLPKNCPQLWGRTRLNRPKPHLKASKGFFWGCPFTPRKYADFYRQGELFRKYIAGINHLDGYGLSIGVKTRLNTYLTPAGLRDNLNL